MISRYGIFCQVIAIGNFTKVAEKIGYSQSAISQTIKTLEQDLGTTLVHRKKDGVTLTADGKLFYPYILAIYTAEEALSKKHCEFKGLEKSIIKIGTFTSVSRNILPQLMHAFKQRHPHVHFVLTQGDYTSIEQWIKEGSIDFGFVNADAVSGIQTTILYHDTMMAVLPKNHPLTTHRILSLHQLADEPLILLDEGLHSVLLNAFTQQNLTPHIEYKVYDDYSILAMVRQGLGISCMYQRVLEGFETDLAIRPISHPPTRPVALAWQNKLTIPYAARQFIDFIRDYLLT